MSVRLKVLHGAIKKRGEWQLTVPIKKSPFIIGQALDCHMRCYGQAISEYHCEIRVAGFDVFVRDLQSQSGTFVNGEKIAAARRFHAGDRIQFGRLAFELLIERPERNSQSDGFGEFVSDLLLEADEAERRDRTRAPETRWYQIEPTPVRDPYEGLTPKERIIAKARKKLPPKQEKPLKLPPRRYVANSAREAVTETLAIYYPGLEVDAAGWNITQT